MSARPIRPRASTLLPALAAAGCALVLTACGSSIASTSTSADSSTGIRFTRCMRGHGISDFPDPLPTGGFPRARGAEQSSPAFGPARKACQGILTAGTPAQGPTEAEQASALTFARCMRADGVPNFPDPQLKTRLGSSSPALVDGDIVFLIGSIDISSPAFQHASNACGHSSPRGPAKGG